MKTNINAASAASDVKIIRWRGGQHPSHTVIARIMEQERLRPYAWTLGPNARQAVRSHGYDKVLYCEEGAVEIFLPDIEQRVALRPGDRIDLPRGARYALIVGPRGAKCVEGERPTLLS